MLSVRSNEYAANARKLNSLGNPAGNSEAGKNGEDRDKSSWVEGWKRALGEGKLLEEETGSAFCRDLRLARRSDTARGSLPCGNMGGPQSLPYTASCASLTLFIRFTL